MLIILSCTSISVLSRLEYLFTNKDWFTKRIQNIVILKGIKYYALPAGIVISSAFGGTSSGNSSLTSDNMSDVFPTPWSPTNNILTLRLSKFDDEIEAMEDATIVDWLIKSLC